jgi:hypothetical protein
MQPVLSIIIQTERLKQLFYLHHIRLAVRIVHHYIISLGLRLNHLMALKLQLVHLRNLVKYLDLLCVERICIRNPLAVAHLLRVYELPYC